MNTLTLEQLPIVITELTERVQRLENATKQSNKPENQTDYLNITEASALTKLSKSTLYIYRGKGIIPSKKNRGRVLFDKDALVDWVEKGAARNRESKVVFQKKAKSSNKKIKK